MGCKLVGYRRVSTTKQGESGLGLEGQDQAIAAYVKTTGCDLVATFTEIESGTHNELVDRPELRKAIAFAKKTKAVLVVAKLDRLTRSLALLGELRKSKVKFVICDYPSANEFTIDILAVFAAEEARKISERTRTALAAYKARGGLLGAARPECRNLSLEDRQRGARAAGEASKRAADEAYADLIPDMISWRERGLSHQAIADKLNEEGHTTRQGAAWNRVQVMRVLKRG